MKTLLNLDTIPQHLQKLPDGRVLSYARFGDPNGEPVYYFHGQPSCRLEAYLGDEPAKEYGFDLYALDRPGHGGSSPFPQGYDMTSWADDVAAFADAHQHTTFGIIGTSGGGSFILACAAKIPHRLSFAYDLAGWAPVHESEALRAGMAPLDRIYASWAPNGGIFFDFSFGILGLVARYLPESVLGWVISSSMAGADRNAWKDPNTGIATIMQAVVKDAFRNGPAGPAYETRLQYGSWGFKLSDVNYPVRFFQGDDDRFAPLEFALYKHRHINSSSVRVFHGQGHFFMLTALGIVFKEVREHSD